MNASAYFKGKKITVMGIDPEGRGVQDALFLAAAGADVLVTDLKPKEELAASIEKLRAYKNIHFALGGHTPEDFRNKDFVVRAASVPLGSPYLEEARKSGVKIVTDETLFLEHAPPVMTIGVTGTRGKTTVTEMIHAILNAAGKKSYLGGNIAGTAMLPLLEKVQEGDCLVMELDSWKLQGFGDAKISPRIAVFATFYPDHLNYYKGDTEHYLADKANIFLYQKPSDTLILGKQCAALIIEKYGDRIDAKTKVADALDFPDTWTLEIPGEHNRYNAALALAAARHLGVDDTISRKALQGFKGVPGRLEFRREVRGVKIYNDTTSTTPTSTITALDALNVGRQTSNIVLIAGGTDKELPLDELIERLQEAKAVVFLQGSGTDRIVSSLQLAAGSQIHGPYDSLQKAVEKGMELASPGDNLLFSPGFTSFEMFKNEYDRGREFNKVIDSL